MIHNKKFLTFLLLFSLSFFLTTNVNAVTTIGLNIDTGGTLTVTGNASLGTVNGNTFTTGTGILTIGAGKTLTISNTLTFAGTNGSTLNIGTGGTIGTAAYTASTAYEASGAITTHAAIQTGIHGLAITAGKTFTLLKSISLTSTDDTGVYTLPTGTKTLLATDGSAAALTSFPTLNQNTTGNAATVTNATLTTALTVNTGTVTLTGNVANTSVLTIGAGAVSVSGSNTGDNAANSSLTYIGTTAVALNRASAALTLAGITLTTPDLGTPSALVGTNITGTAANLTAGLATSLAGGSGGTIPYQSSAGVTAMLANGTAGQVLQSNGTTLAPSWVAASAGDMVLASIQTVTGAKTFNSGKLILAGATSGSTILNAAAVAGTTTITLPGTSGTVLLTDGSAASLTSFPTLNQNTTGSAATLTTTRAIYGNNFDGSAALTGIIASTYGGTGNGFTKFSGPTTSEKTFTLPDASATIATIDATQTFTNKRTNPRIISAASYTTDTGTSLDVSTADQFVITAQTGALLFNAPGGTPVEGQKLIIRIKDNGTARALTYNAIFRAMGVALPTTTVLSKTLYMGFIYNITDTKWDLVAVAQEA